MKKNKLQQYFPMIRTRQEILNIIQGNSVLLSIFNGWSSSSQKLFLDICSGAKGHKILYDPYFKEIFSPEIDPGRLELFLSVLLQQPVKIMEILPNDSTRITDESSLLVTDIVIRLADKSYANLEIQKQGYLFPGQRAACYSSDLLLRQYKKVRDEHTKETFHYRDIKDVYVIVLLEKSTAEFHAFPDKYRHCFELKSDTGLELELLQHYLFFPLDIFHNVMQNKDTYQNELEAWLTFLTEDDPDKILELLRQKPDFMPFYQHIYDMCRNVEKVMGMFSEELRMLDKNTVHYMIDEMQNTIDEQNRIIQNEQKNRKENERKLQEKDHIIQMLQNELSQLKQQ